MHGGGGTGECFCCCYYIYACVCVNSSALVDGIVFVTHHRDNGNTGTGGCTGLYSLCYI